MTNQHTTPQTTATPQTTRPRVRAILVAAALIILLLSLDQSAAGLSDYLDSVAKDTIALLPSLAITAAQALHPDASAHHQFSLCSLQMLLFWPALHTVAKVAVA
jgi:hypothetical protein